MHIALANMLVYIYDNLYGQSRMKDTLTLYSDAIVQSLTTGGSLYSLYLAVRTVGLPLAQSWREGKPPHP